MPGTKLPLKVRLLGPVLRQLRPAWLATWAKRVVGVPRVDVRVEPSLTFRVDPVSHLGHHLIQDGVYEPVLTQLFTRTLRPGDTFLDVGANEGYFTVLGGRLVGPSGRVLAVEPQSRLRSVLEDNFRLNGLTHVTLVSAAVSDAEGTAEIHLAPDLNSGSSGFHRATKYRVATEPVRVTTLSRLLAEHGIDRVDFLKMDIEGFEYEALLGSKELFAKGVVRAMAIELHPWAITGRGLDPNRISEMLLSCGYRKEEVGDTTLFTRGDFEAGPA